MTSEVPGSTPAPRGQAGWRPWLGVAAVAAVLLLLSEALWLWQTWPVRELLEPMTVSAPRNP
jgi:hypothetical protein